MGRERESKSEREKERARVRVIERKGMLKRIEGRTDGA